MNLQATKLDVMQKLMSVSRADLLQKISKLLDKEMIVGYTTSGKPLTKEAYNKRLQTAEKQLIAGQYTTHEDLEKEIENW